jgi:protein involved in polysaccharide export with SLBB domain
MECIRRILILSLIALLPGCTMLGTYMDPLNPAPSYKINGQVKNIRFVNLSPAWIVNHNTTPTYRVGPYDILNVIVWDHPELTTVSTQMSTPDQSGLLVSAQGEISFPFAGTFRVAGLTLPEIEKLVEKRISNYIRDPQVTVRVVTFRSQEAQVLGEVGGQRTVPLTDKPTSLLDALNQAGGTSVLSANTTRIYVIRGNVNDVTVFKLNAKSPEMMVVAQHFNIKNNDIIYVSPLSITSWNRVMSQLLPTLGNAALVQATVKSMS